MGEVDMTLRMSLLVVLTLVALMLLLIPTAASAAPGEAMGSLVSLAPGSIGTAADPAVAEADAP